MMQRHQSSRLGSRDKPTWGDRLVVLVFSLAFLFLLVPEAYLLHGSAWAWVVMGAVIGLPVVTINILLPFS